MREEGVLSLWRGNGSSVIRYYASVALNINCITFFLYVDICECLLSRLAWFKIYGNIRACLYNIVLMVVSCMNKNWCTHVCPVLVYNSVFVFVSLVQE